MTICITLPSLAVIGQTISGIWRSCDCSKWRRPPSCIFKFSKWSEGSRGSNCVTMPNFFEIGQTAVDIWRFFNFPRWRPSAILDLWCVCSDHPRRAPPWRAFGGLYHCAKFGWNRYSSFDNMQLLLFRDLGFKTPIHAPKIGFLGDLTPKWRAVIATPKRHFLCGSASYDV